MADQSPVSPLEELLRIKFEDLPQKDFSNMSLAEVLGISQGQAYRAQVGQASSSSSGFVTITSPDGKFTSGVSPDNVAVSLPYFQNVVAELDAKSSAPISGSRLPTASDKSPGMVKIYNDGQLIAGLVQEVPTQAGMERAISKAMESAVTPDTLPKASTTQPGIVRLDSNIASLSEETAPTSLALKTVSDEVTAVASAPVTADRLPVASQTASGISKFARYGVDSPSATQMVSSQDLYTVATAPVPASRLPEGTLSQKGILALSSDYTTSTDQTKAATIGALHSVYQLIGSSSGDPVPGSYTQAGGFVIGNGPDASGMLSANPNNIQTSDGMTYSSIPSYDQINKVTTYLSTASVAASRLTGVIAAGRLPEASESALGAIKVTKQATVPSDSSLDALVPTVAMVRNAAGSGSGTTNAVRYDILQSLTSQQQSYARQNIGFDAAVKNTLIPSMAVRYDTSQSLSSSQQQIARNNIGAAAVGQGGSFEYNGWVTGDLGQEVSYVPLSYAGMTSALQRLNGNLMPTIGAGSTSAMAEASYIPSAGSVMRWMATILPAYAGMIYNTMIPSMAVRYDAIQTLTTQQKELARANIGVTSTGGAAEAATPTVAGVVYIDAVPQVTNLYYNDASRPSQWMVDYLDGIASGSVTSIPGWAFYGITQVPGNRALTYEGFTSLWNSLLPAYTAEMMFSWIPRYLGSVTPSSLEVVPQTVAMGVAPGDTSNRLYTEPPNSWRDKVPSNVNYQEWYPNPGNDSNGYYTDIAAGSTYTIVPWDKNATFGTVITILSSMIPSMMLYLQETLIPTYGSLNTGRVVSGDLVGNNGVPAMNMIAPDHIANHNPPTGTSDYNMWYSCIPSMKAVYSMIKSLVPAAASWGGVWDA